MAERLIRAVETEVKLEEKGFKVLRTNRKKETTTCKCGVCGHVFRVSWGRVERKIDTENLCEICREKELQEEMNRKYKEAGSTLVVCDDMYTLCCEECGREYSYNTKITKSFFYGNRRICDCKKGDNFGAGRRPKKPVTIDGNGVYEYYLVDQNNTELIVKTTDIKEIEKQTGFSEDEIEYIAKNHLRVKTKTTGTEIFIMKMKN